jgi:predicted dehydrogenase
MLTKTPVPALVVGTGFGCRVHVPALRAAGFSVEALVGTNPGKLEKRAGQNNVPRWFTDLDEAISATNAELVSIATPPARHAALALQAIARGCHVLCEKPFAFDAAEGATMLAAAETAGVVHMVAHEFRWLPDRALFGRAIAEGLIGEPRFLAMDQFIPFCADPATPLPKWWFDPAAGGGWLGASGSHLLDQIRAWLGDIASLSGRLLLVSDREVACEDSYSLRFTLASGAEGSMQQSAGAWGPATTLWRCAGSKGTIWIEAGKVMVADNSGMRELPVPDDLLLPAPPPAADSASSNRLSHFEIGPFTRLAQALHDAIAGGSTSSPVPVPTFADGLASMRIMDAIRSSSAAGGELQRL